MNTTNDIVIGIMALMMLGITIYVFGGAFIDILKEKFQKTNFNYDDYNKELKNTHNV